MEPVMMVAGEAAGGWWRLKVVLVVVMESLLVNYWTPKVRRHRQRRRMSPLLDCTKPGDTDREDAGVHYWTVQSQETQTKKTQESTTGLYKARRDRQRRRRSSLLDCTKPGETDREDTGVHYWTVQSQETQTKKTQESTTGLYKARRHRQRRHRSALLDCTKPGDTDREDSGVHHEITKTNL